jgi:hypothetical protein
MSNRRTINIPTQPNTITRPLVIDEVDALNNTHPIENKSEAQHKSQRIVLDNLLDIIADQ